LLSMVVRWALRPSLSLPACRPSALLLWGVSGRRPSLVVELSELQPRARVCAKGRMQMKVMSGWRSRVPHFEGSMPSLPAAGGGRGRSHSCFFSVRWLSLVHFRLLRRRAGERPRCLQPSSVGFWFPFMPCGRDAWGMSSLALRAHSRKIHCEESQKYI
jgi:hypothetical protein